MSKLKTNINSHPASSNRFLPENDGIDHINVFSRGKTKLGRILSNFAYTPFLYEGIYYKSVEGALFHYRTLDDSFIKLYGFKAKELGKELPSYRLETPALIKSWFRAKLEYNPEIKEMLIENELPFAHYYMFDKKIKAELICPDIWRELTNELREMKFRDAA